VDSVAAGAVARKLLRAQGIEVVAYVTELGGIAAKIDTNDLAALRAQAEANAVRCPDPAAAERMMERLQAARGQGDSLGGMVVIVAEGGAAGLGDAIPAIRKELISK